MIYKVYSMYDSGAQFYTRPFFAKADGEATRLFVDIAKDNDSAIGKHPSDYALFRLGTFDDGKGDFESETSPVKIMTGHEAKAFGENNG